MKIARYEIDGAVYYGVLDGETLRRLPGSPFEKTEPTGRTDALKDVKLLAPLDRPRIFGVGMNYVAHIKEMNHSSRFWKQVERCYPDWREARDWLHTRGGALHSIGD